AWSRAKLIGAVVHSKLHRFMLIGSLALMICANAPVAQAQTWTGGGANNNWNTSLNWNTGVPSNDGFANVTFAGGTRLTPSVNQPWDINRISFALGAGAFGIGGTTLIIEGTNGTGVVNNSTNLQAISTSISLVHAQMWNAASGGL